MLPPAGPRRPEDLAAGYGAAEEPAPPRQPPGSAQRLHSGIRDRWGLDGRKMVRHKKVNGVTEGIQ